MKFSLRLNAVLKIFLSVLNILIPFFVGPYIIRILSRNSYDLYTKAAVEIQLFLALVTGAIYVYGIRTISKIRQDKEKVSLFFSELFIIGLFFNIFFLVFYFLYTRFVNHSPESIYYIFMLQFIGTAFQVEWLNEAEENYLFITLKSLFIKGGYLAAIFLFVRADNLLRYGLIVSLTNVADSLVSFIYLYRKNKMSFRNLNLKRHLKKVFLAFLITNISLLYVQTDKIMLGLLISDAAVAAYTIPNYIVTSLYNIVISIFVVAIPRLTSLLHNKKTEEYKTLYNELVQAFLMIFIPILFYMFINAEELIVLYAAGKYNDSIVPLRLSTIYIFFNSLVYIQREGVLYLSERERPIIVCNLLGGLFNLLSNTVLSFLNHFNPVTAIVTLIISYVLVTILLRIYISKKITPKLKLVNLRILSYFLFSFPMILIAAFLSLFKLSRLAYLAASLVIFIGVYSMLLIIFKDRIFLDNLKTSYLKVKNFLRRKKE
ncbi:MAG TPA: oligosaccharide flippase family protein [Bacilli bacterium]